jgi:PAS domain S-box-containing protein
MNSPSSDANWPLIYVVDDDEDARENLRDILEFRHYRMFDAGNALELFELPAWDEVSVVLLDRQLPDASPQELLPKIKSRAPLAGVIIVTGHGDIEGAVACLRAGARDYILKPINTEALLASVSRELDRQSAAATLASSEGRYNALFESAIDGYLILNSEWQILEANPAACQMLGWEGSDILGRHIKSFVVQGSNELQLPDTSSRHNQISGECRLLRENGIPINTEYRLVTNFTPGLQLFSFCDVTDRKKAEERARQSERLAAIGETMAALTHESRNALQRSSASLELLEIELEDRPGALQLVERAKLAQEQLRQLFEEVRQWAAPFNLSPDQCNLKGVWREAWGHVAQVHPAKREALREQIDCEPNCRIDRSLMHHVFRNIFENAVEVTPEGGSILVFSSKVSFNGKTTLRILIRDEGPGLTPEQQARIFEPFFTTKTKGTGLGMSLCQRIVHAHDGAIAAASPGGAEIEITLPMTGQ